MSRRWKIALALVLSIPLVLFTAFALSVDKDFGRKAVWQLISGTLLGTRARPLTNRTFQSTLARLERGKYLAEGLAACLNCHTGCTAGHIRPSAARRILDQDWRVLRLSIMPWRRWGKVADEDFRAIFAYLRSIPPVKHRVDNTEPPTYCKFCRHKHGGGVLK